MCIIQYDTNSCIVMISCSNQGLLVFLIGFIKDWITYTTKDDMFPLISFLLLKAGGRHLAQLPPVGV